MSQDIDELTALNRDYVASVQNCDVKRFDEILAQDFYCTNPDKSLVDRAGFLKQTAIPVTIRNLIADDVKIRVLGDFAIIHGRTSYTTSDGKQAYGRYTDCWAKQNGRWLAVSAHVVAVSITSASSRRTPGPIVTGVSFAKSVCLCAFSIDHAVWAPAFAGTTHTLTHRT